MAPRPGREGVAVHLFRGPPAARPSCWRRLAAQPIQEDREAIQGGMLQAAASCRGGNDSCPERAHILFTANTFESLVGFQYFICLLF